MGDMYTNPPQSRNEAILRAMIDGTEYTDPPQSRIEDLLIELKETIESGGSKIKLADVSGAAVALSFNTASLTWTDPEDIIVSGSTLAKWKGTKVLRKVGSAPEDINDGTLVVDSTVKNQYSSSGFTDTNLEYGTMYYYRWFPYTEEGMVTDGTSISCTPVRTKITTVPTQDGTLTYDGTEQTASFNDYDSDKMTVTGNTGMNAGSYTAQFTPKDGYCWDDDSLTAKDVTWTIDKATGVISLSESSVSLNAQTLYADITITPTGDGELSVASDDTSVATVSAIQNNVFRVSADEAGSATVTVSMAASANYTSASATLSVSVVYAHIYGAEWDGTSSPAWTRTDEAENFTDPNPYYSGMSGTPSSPFDNLMPWSGMTIVEDADAGTLVRIPKFWFKWTLDGDKMKLQIADGEVDGFSVSPAHMDRGDGQGERDIVYIGRYHVDSQYKSTTNVVPVVSVGLSTARSGIHNIGSEYWTMDFAMYWTIAMLYIVEFANWNTQEKIGYGGLKAGLTEKKNGGTDAMPYHTGTAEQTRDTYGYVQYRNIENLWGLFQDFIDGVFHKSDSYDTYCILNPNDFSDVENGIFIGRLPQGDTQVCLKGFMQPSVQGFEWALLPAGHVNDQTFSTYVCDYTYAFSGTKFKFGSDTSNANYNSQSVGLFKISAGSSGESASGTCSARTMRLPNNS